MTQTKIPESGLVQQRHDVDVLIALCAVSFMPLFFYGFYAVRMLLTAMVTAIITEYICQRIAGKKRIEKGDLSHIITAFVTALLLPATTPLWICSAAVVFGLCVAKHPFGGRGANIFNPAAAGVAFVTLCWTDAVTKYPVPFSEVNGVFSFADSPASTLRIGGTPKIELFDTLLGDFGGPMGATCLIVLAACFAFLAYRRSVCTHAVIPAFCVVVITAILFPRLNTGIINSLVFELCSGAFIFGLTFMINDPATLPSHNEGKIAYGLLIGVLVVLFRRFGKFDVEMAFVMLLANALASSCDGYAIAAKKLIGKHKAILADKRAEKLKEKAGEADV